MLRVIEKQKNMEIFVLHNRMKALIVRPSIHPGGDAVLKFKNIALERLRLLHSSGADTTPTQRRRCHNSSREAWTGAQEHHERKQEEQGRIGCGEDAGVFVAAGAVLGLMSHPTWDLGMRCKKASYRPGFYPH